MGRKKKLINNSGIPQHEIEHIARCILPDILAYYESEEASESFGNGRLSVKRNRRKERKGKGASGGNAGWQQSTGLLHFIVRVPFIWNTKTVYPGWNTQK